MSCIQKSFDSIEMSIIDGRLVPFQIKNYEIYGSKIIYMVERIVETDIQKNNLISFNKNILNEI